MLSEEALVERLSRIAGAEHLVAEEKTLAYAVDGKVPQAVVFPASVDELSGIMSFASAEGLKIVPRGSGTKIELGGIPEQVDIVIALSRLNRLIDHEPNDMTATFEAGILLKDAQTILSRSNQFIALDPPHADLATIGGILATNSSGPKRHRYGTGRDLVLAMRLVHADGKVSKCGAKVVKNVTGYDLNKLYIGSLGTLAIIAEATFRLYPIPACEKSCLAPFPSVDEAWTVVARILDSPLVPSAVVLLNPEACRYSAGRVGLSWPERSYGLAVGMSSVHQEAVNTQLNTVRQHCAEAGADGEILESDSHKMLWQAIRDFESGEGPRVVLKASVLLTKVTEGVKLGEEMAAHLGFGCGTISEAGSGIIRYYFSGKGCSIQQFQQGATEIITRLRSFARETGGSLVVQEAPAEVKSRIDVWGSVGKTLPLMRGLKEQFDPQRILNPGRFVGGI